MQDASDSESEVHDDDDDDDFEDEDEDSETGDMGEMLVDAMRHGQLERARGYAQQPIDPEALNADCDIEDGDDRGSPLVMALCAKPCRSSQSCASAIRSAAVRRRGMI